jgi:hypothetical protein
MSNEIRKCIEEMDKKLGSILGPVIYCYKKHNKLDELERMIEEFVKVLRSEQKSERG